MNLSENRDVFKTAFVWSVARSEWAGCRVLPQKTLPFYPYGLGGGGVYARPLGLLRGAEAIAVVLHGLLTPSPPRNPP